MHINKPSKILYSMPPLTLFAVMLFSDAVNSIFYIENIWIELFEGLGLYGAIGLGIYQYRKYVKDFKKFVVDIKKFGQKREIVDYQVVSSESSDNTVVHKITATMNLNGKEQKISSRINPAMLTVIAKMESLILYYDPMNTEKFIYYVDLPQSNTPTFTDLYKLYKKDPSSLKFKRLK